MSTLQRSSLTAVAVCAAAMMVVSTTWARSKNTDPNNCSGKAWVAYYDCTKAGMSDKYCADVYNRTLNNCFSRTHTGGAPAQDLAPPPTAPTTATPSTTVSPPTTAGYTSLKSKSSAFSVQTSVAAPVTHSYSSVGVTTVPKSMGATPFAAVHGASTPPMLAHNGKQGTPSSIPPTKRDGKR